MRLLARATQVVALALISFGPVLASDGYVYNAPQTATPLVIDGEFNDWPADEVLPWEPMARTYSHRGTPRQGDEDFNGAFKMMWGYGALHWYALATGVFLG